ncbi:MAG: HAMP domain-containing protein [Deltaproteobacteria bacterium]|nr:HAMP domain-containing protein [Deltaproteobacteria bacterium]
MGQHLVSYASLHRSRGRAHVRGNGPAPAQEGWGGMLARLNTLRVRLVLGFVAAFLGMALFGALTYRHFIDIQQKLMFLSQADALVNTGLEARRYEKNHFLYHHEADYQAALGYLAQFERTLASAAPHLAATGGPARAARLAESARDYRQEFTQVHAFLGEHGFTAADDPALAPRVARLRKAGQRLIIGAEEAAQGERERVQGLLQDYPHLLIAFLVCLAGLGAVVLYLLTVKLVRPLRLVEDATRVVAQGDFRTLPWNHRQDEIGNLVQAFNRMVVHLRQNSEQMIQTEKLTALGTLTSGVAHELNNPLNNISTSCQILLEELEGVTAAYHAELLKAIESQVAKARDIVSSLLEFARQREFELKPEDLGEVVQEALKLIKGEIPAGVKVNTVLPAGVVAEVDKAHLVQALINLIMNGIQAMQEAGTLAILVGQSPEREEAVIDIRDSGPGIAPEVLPRIFDPFFTTKDVGRGTGLGLSITYGIVERHHGRIEVESEPGLGARFTLRLPVRAEGV